MTVYVPALIMLIGLIGYLGVKHSDWKAIFKDCFWTGLLITLIQLASHKINLP